MKKFILLLSIISGSLALSGQINTDRIMSIGKNALYFEDYVLSIQYFNQVIRLKPYLWEPYMQRAIAKIQLGDFKSAEADCDEAIKRNPFAPQAFYTRGFARMRLSKYEDAASDFTKALEFSPHNTFFLINRLEAYERLGEYEKAMEDLKLYQQLNPKAIHSLYDLGRLQLAMKDTIAAEKTFDDLIDKDRNSSFGWSARGLLRLQKKELDGALEDYNEAIKRNSTFVGDFINRGIIHQQKNNFIAALDDYNEAIKRDKNNALAYYNRGLLRTYLGDKNNALDDLKKVVALDDSYIEARWQKASVEMDLGYYSDAIEDYRIIIETHPSFLPAYIAIAQAYNEKGDRSKSRQYQQLAREIEQNKGVVQKQEEFIADNKISSNAQNSRTTGRRTNLFNRYAAQNLEVNQSESKYADNPLRGTVQDIFTDIIPEKNYVLTYYTKNEELKRTNLYNIIIENYNNENKEYTTLRITNNEIPLTENMLAIHFDAINRLSEKLSKNENDADAYFRRAMEFYIIQDYESAIDDLNKAIVIRPDFILAYFSRANIRYKLLEYIRNVESETEFTTVAAASQNKTNESLSKDKKFALDMELIIYDYDQANKLAEQAEQPFPYVHYNKGNVLFAQQDLRGAILSYTDAINADSEFSEAYYNRGLIYIFTGEDDKGLADLSKAGELGIYKVYNLIQRFK